jgi:hypothetical protein
MQAPRGRGYIACTNSWPWYQIRSGHHALAAHNPQYPLGRRLGGPLSRSGQRLDEKIFCLCWVLNPSHPVCSQTLDWLSYPDSLYLPKYAKYLWVCLQIYFLKILNTHIKSILNDAEICTIGLIKPVTLWSFIRKYHFLKIMYTGLCNCVLINTTARWILATCGHARIKHTLVQIPNYYQSALKMLSVKISYLQLYSCYSNGHPTTFCDKSWSLSVISIITSRIFIPKAYKLCNL